MKKTKHWSEALDSALAECGVDKICLDKPGEDWFRIKDMMQKTGLGETGARKLIEKLLKQGKIEKKMFKVRNSQDQKIYPAPHYRFL
jgi:hypothetical protein